MDEPAPVEGDDSSHWWTFEQYWAERRRRDPGPARMIVHETLMRRAASECRLEPKVLAASYTANPESLAYGFFAPDGSLLESCANYGAATEWLREHGQGAWQRAEAAKLAASVRTPPRSKQPTL
jgi:hypothetical protein